MTWHCTIVEAVELMQFLIEALRLGLQAGLAVDRGTLDCSSDESSSDSEFRGSSSSCISSLATGPGLMTTATNHSMVHTFLQKLRADASVSGASAAEPHVAEQLSCHVKCNGFVKLQQLNNKSEKPMVMPDFVGSLHSLCLDCLCMDP
jgi:hypothetical protein